MRNTLIIGIVALLLAMSAFATSTFAQQATITVLSAVANNGSDPAGAKQITLKDHFSQKCNGLESCAQMASEVVPDNNFVIEIIYTCRDASGASREFGPKHFGSRDTVELSCR